MKIKKRKKCPVCNSSRYKQSEEITRCDKCGYEHRISEEIKKK